ncbi:MAG: DUF3592 domain-containing protein [Bacteroidales bacterium]|nr:DUF3592 domain-containing protein [Bacteroidales bacterium]
MKVYRISKWAFGGICLLILLLPVSRYWQLLATGDRTTGTVTRYVMRMIDKLPGQSYPAEVSEIEFQAEGVVYRAYGPVNYEYQDGRRLTVIYRPNNPAENCVFTFTAFYLDNYVVLPIILLTLWYAFYLTFNNYSKRSKKSGGGAAPSGGRTARSSAHPLRRIPFL